jgi:hypothetical protein
LPARYNHEQREAVDKQYSPTQEWPPSLNAALSTQPRQPSDSLVPAMKSFQQWKASATAAIRSNAAQASAQRTHTKQLKPWGTLVLDQLKKYHVL